MFYIWTQTFLKRETYGDCIIDRHYHIACRPRGTSTASLLLHDCVVSYLEVNPRCSNAPSTAVCYQIHPVSLFCDVFWLHYISIKGYFPSTIVLMGDWIPVIPLSTTNGYPQMNNYSSFASSAPTEEKTLRSGLGTRVLTILGLSQHRMSDRSRSAHERRRFTCPLLYDHALCISSHQVRLARMLPETRLRYLSVIHAEYVVA